MTAIEDPTADDGWNNGCDFAMTQLCKFLSVDPESVNWDAATETIEGDVQAVIGNILRAKFGDDWSPSAPPAPGSERELSDLIAAYYRNEIGVLMHQAEHWAKQNYPLAVHHRVCKADSYYQIVALCERFAKFGENIFTEMREALVRKPVYPHGTYPPIVEINQYRNPKFVVEKLKTALKDAGGDA